MNWIWIVAALILPLQCYTLWYVIRDYRRTNARLRHWRKECAKQEARFRELEKLAGLNTDGSPLE